MPPKNRIKTYVGNSYYHIYNRGVNKMDIFRSGEDYNQFLKYLREALVKPIEKKIEIKINDKVIVKAMRTPKNFKDEITLVAYCLMPNHFHLLIMQKGDRSIESFMRSTTTRYSMYFNKKYKRTGPLFQGRYKAVIVTKDEYLLHLSRYIHRNPLKLSKDLTEAYSSYKYYLKQNEPEWINTDIILNMFRSTPSSDFKNLITYKEFVENYKNASPRAFKKLKLD